MFHIAATLGMTVQELDEKLTYQEYMGWIEYFNTAKTAEGEDDPTNMMDSPEAMLKGFGL